MALKDIKIKNNNESSSGVDPATQGPPTVLALVQDAVTLDSNPNIKQAAEITLKIVQKVQSVKDHKANFQRLADDVAGWIAGIWKSCQELPAGKKQNWPPKNDIEELVSILAQILGFVEDHVKRSRTDRVLSTFTDPRKIQEYRERVQGTIRNLEANSHINHALNQIRIKDEKERTPDTELRQLTEKKARMIEEEPHQLQAKGKFSVTEEEARQPQRLSHISDERAKERLRVPESDYLAKEEIERLRDEIRVMKEANKAAEEKQRERKREEKEMDPMVPERENERRRQSEEMARVEAEEQRKRERILIAEEVPVRQEAVERLCETEATRIAEGKKKKKGAGRAAIVTPHPKLDNSLKVSGKMKFRLEQEDDDRTVVSEQDKSAQKPARKPADKNKKTNNAPMVPSVGAFTGHPSLAPSPPLHHLGQSPDVFPHAYPWYPPHGSLPATNHINGFNNARIAGGIKIGNITNSDITRGGDTVSLQERAAVSRQKQARRPKSGKVTF